MTGQPIDLSNIGLDAVTRTVSTDEAAGLVVKRFSCSTVDAADQLYRHLAWQAHTLAAANRHAQHRAGQQAFAKYAALRHHTSTSAQAATDQAPQVPPDMYQWATAASDDSSVTTTTELHPPARWDTADAARLGWLAGLAEGLDRLHKLGAVHGDVKPGNCARVDGGIVLVDFDSVSDLENPSAIHSSAYQHPSSLDRPRTGASAQADDRMGFFAICVAAVFGRDVEGQLFGSGSRRSPQQLASLLRRNAPQHVRQLLLRVFEKLLANDAADVWTLSCAHSLQLLREAAVQPEVAVAAATPSNPVIEALWERVMPLRGEQYSELAEQVLWERVWSAFLTRFLSLVLPMALVAVAVFAMVVTR